MPTLSPPSVRSLCRRLQEHDHATTLARMRNHGSLIDRPIFALVVVLLVAVGLVLLDRIIGEGWLSWDYWLKGSTNMSRSEVVRNLGLLALAMIGLGFGMWRSWTAHIQAQAAQRQSEAANEQARIAEQGQITDRFAKAVELLGDKSSAMTRAAAIYALGRIARDSMERDHIAVMQLLCQFVRHSPYAEEQERVAENYESRIKDFLINSTQPGVSWPDPPRAQECPDIIAALEVIVGRSEEQKVFEREIKYFPDLTSARLPWLNFQGAKLYGLNFCEADFRGANLTDAELRWAELGAAVLSGARLTNADLREADLCACIFSWRNLGQSVPMEAGVPRVALKGASLIGANLREADVTGADFRDANLTMASLHEAVVQDADFRDTNLSLASFSAARFLTREQVTEAYVSNPNIQPQWPPTEEFKGLELPIRP